MSRPCHLDLMSTDLETSTAFYAAVLGWTYVSMGPAFIAQVPSGAAGAIVPPFDGTTTGWTLYFSSDDVATTEAAIVSAGGTIVLPHGDVHDAGKLLLARDPTGARFGVWQAGRAKGVDEWGSLGAPTWTDLRSTDPDAARSFYAAVFAFAFRPLPDAGPDYTTFSADGDEPLGGIGGMMGHEGIGSHWLITFSVPDADAASAACRAAGGQALSDPFDTLYGRMAPLADPHGNPFWVVQPP